MMGADSTEEDGLLCFVHILNKCMISKAAEPSITGPTPVYVTYSPLASMNHQWTINLPFYAVIPGESISTSHPTLCNV